MPDNRAHVATTSRRAGLVLAMLLSAMTWQAPAFAQVLTKFFEYPVPNTATTFPLNPVVGSDGNLWFVEEYANNIAKMTPAGEITEYPVPTINSEPRDIALGSDSNLWFTENAGNNIGRITTSGVITEFPIALVGSAPGAITAGPDGNIWFGQEDGNIGCISVVATNVACPQSGGAPAITEFPLPTGYSEPQFMTSGPDGNIWFTEPSSGAIAKMTTTGSTFTAYSSGLPSGSKPYGITPCPSAGSCLWFTVDNKSKIGQITTTGTITTFGTPTSSSGPCCITVGPDNNLWFTENAINKIAVSTTSGSITEYAIPTADSDSGTITSFNGGLYFVEELANKIGQSTTAGSITETPISTLATSQPWSVRIGENGELWTAESFGNDIARITSGTRGCQELAVTACAETATPPLPLPGTFTQYALVTALSEPRGIALGSDGNMWFAEFGNNKIGRITRAGAITEFSVPTSASKPRGITAGSDGNLWFTEQSGNNIGCVAIVATNSTCPQSDGQPTITEFPIPTTGALPHGITAGPDGNVWFVEYAGNNIGCFSIADTACPAVVVAPAASASAGNKSGCPSVCPQTEAPRITEYSVTTPASGPTNITEGPDGALWFVEKEGNKIGRFDNGAVTNEYSVPTAGSQPSSIGTGPDGALWFTELQTGKIGRITTQGVITSEYPVPTANSGPAGIITGPDNALWFAEQAGNKIGRLVLLKLVVQP